MDQLLDPPLDPPGKYSQFPFQVATSPRHMEAASLLFDPKSTIIHHSVGDTAHVETDFTWIRVLEINDDGTMTLWADQSVFIDRDGTRGELAAMPVIDKLGRTTNGTAVLLGRTLEEGITRLIIGDQVMDIPAYVDDIKVVISGEIVFLTYPGEDEWYEQIIGPQQRDRPQPPREMTGISTHIYDEVMSFRWWSSQASFCNHEDGCLMRTQIGEGRWEEQELGRRVQWVAPSPRGFGMVYLACGDDPNSKVLMWDGNVLARGAIMAAASDVHWSPDGSEPAVSFRKLPFDTDILALADAHVVTPSDKLEVSDANAIREPVIDDNGRIIAAIVDIAEDESVLHMPNRGDVSSAEYIWNLRLEDQRLVWNSLDAGVVCVNDVSAETPSNTLEKQRPKAS